MSWFSCHVKVQKCIDKVLAYKQLKTAPNIILPSLHYILPLSRRSSQTHSQVLLRRLGTVEPTFEAVPAVPSSDSALEDSASGSFTVHPSSLSPSASASTPSLKAITFSTCDEASSDSVGLTSAAESNFGFSRAHHTVPIFEGRRYSIHCSGFALSSTKWRIALTEDTGPSCSRMLVFLETAFFVTFCRERD